MEKHEILFQTSLNEKSFRELFDLYFEPICRLLNFYTKDTDLIQDVVQDVFVKLWEERETLEISYAKTYLYSMARNRILNQIRDEQNRLRLLEEWAIREYESKKGIACVDLDEFTSLLQKAIDTLPEKYRDIFVLNREQKWTYSQIAEYKSMPVKTVETQMGVALKRIREYLSAHYKQLLIGIFFLGH